MRDSGVALGRTQPHIPHASIASFEGVMPKNWDWKKEASGNNVTPIKPRGRVA
jgi:hypothetical protein